MIFFINTTSRRIAHQLDQVVTIRFSPCLFDTLICCLRKQELDGTTIIQRGRQVINLLSLRFIFRLKTCRLHVERIDFYNAVSFYYYYASCLVQSKQHHLISFLMRDHGVTSTTPLLVEGNGSRPNYMIITVLNVPQRKNGISKFNRFTFNTVKYPIIVSAKAGKFDSHEPKKEKYFSAFQVSAQGNSLLR